MSAKVPKMFAKKTLGRIALIGVWGLLSVLWPSPKAYAWGNTWMGISLERLLASLPVKVGPAKVDAAVRLGSAGYDSNVYFGSPGEPIGDTTFRIGPDVRVYLPLAKGTVLEVRDFPQYGYYAELKNERSWNNTFQGRLHLAFKNSFFRLDESLANVKDRLNSEVFVNIRQKAQITQALYLWQASRTFSLMAQGGHSRFQYEDTTFGAENVRSGLNRREDTGTITVYYQETAGTRFDVTGSYGHFVFDSASFKNSRSYALSAGVEFLRTTGIGGSLGIGYKYFDLTDPAGKDFQGPFGDVRISFRLIKHTSFAALVSRDTVFSIWSGSAYYVQNLIGGELYRQLSRRATLSYALSYGTNRYPAMAGETGKSRIDDYFLHSVSLALRLRRGLDVAARVDLRTRTNNLGLPADRRSFFGLDLVYRF